MPIDSFTDIDLTFHHTGILVKNIEEAALYYGQVFGRSKVSEIYDVHSQQVSVCFIATGNKVYLELVAPFEGNKSFESLYKRGITYYHSGYLTANFEATLKALEALDFRVISTFNSEAFNGKRCSFMLSKKMHLFELIEK